MIALLGIMMARSTIGDVIVRVSIVLKEPWPSSALGANSLATTFYQVCVYPIGCPQEPIHIDAARSESVARRQYRIACEAARRAKESPCT